MTKPSNADIARRGYEAALRGDLDTLRDFLHPDVTWHSGDPSARDACHDRRQALAVMARAKERGRIGELLDVREAGDRVVVIMRRGPDDVVANVTTLSDGRAVEMVHYPDADDALRAVGLL